MDTQMPQLDLQQVLSGGLMQGVADAMSAGNISLTFPAPGVVLANHVYIPVLPPLPILPVFIIP